MRTHELGLPRVFCTVCESYDCPQPVVAEEEDDYYDGPDEDFTDFRTHALGEVAL